MQIDHILYLSSLEGKRTWICQITESDGMRRVWRAEHESPNPKRDEISKEIVVEEAFRQFYAATSQMADA